MRPTRLVKIVVRNISAVDKAANKRKWLLVKAADPAALAKGIKSENERRRIVEQAVRDRWGSTIDYSKAYLDDIWDGDEAIVCKDGAYYSVPFTIDADNKISFGEMTAVSRAWVEKRQQERFEKIRWTAGYVTDLPDSAFAVVSAGGEKDDDGKTTPRSLRHLPFRNSSGEVDRPHLRNALARVNQIDASDADKAKARKKLDTAAREAGVGEYAEKANPITFDDAMMGRRLHQVYVALGERYGALMETMDSIRQSAEGNKVGAIKDALGSFLESLASIPDMLDSDDDLEKVGRKISAYRMSKLKALVKVLGDIIAEGEAAMAMAEKGAPDAKTLSGLGARLAAMFAPLFGADADTVNALEKQASGTVEPPIPDAVRAVLTKAEAAIDDVKAENATLKTESADLKGKLEKAQTDLTALHDAASLRKFADEVAGYRDIGLDPAKDAALLKSIDAHLSKDEAARVREILNAIKAQKAAAGLMGEIGSSGAGMLAADSAAALVEAKIGEAMSKSDKVDRRGAMDQVFRENPGLFERWQTETTTRV